MATTYADRGLARVETTGSIVEAVGGIAVVVLSIIELTRGGVGVLTPIAVIILGAALLAEGSSIASEFSRLLSAGVTGGIADGQGLMGEMAVGAAVIVLGILALVGIAPATMIAIAVLASGALMLVSAPSANRMSQTRLETTEVPAVGQQLVQTAGSAATGLQVIVGLAAVVLGIIALTNAAMAMTLVLAGLLILGAAILISAQSVTTQMTRLLHH